MKTKKDFLNNYVRNKDLARKTLKQGGVNWGELKERPNDFYAANTGAVNGMIYYKDTVKFARKNHLLILQTLQEYEEEVTGEPLKKPKPTEETEYFNWLAWFAWENTMLELITYLEE